MKRKNFYHQELNKYQTVSLPPHMQEYILLAFNITGQLT